MFYTSLGFEVLLVKLQLASGMLSDGNIAELEAVNL
jgi:hypothetical protein